MQRFHQLTGPNNKVVGFAPGATIQYYFTDLPIKSQICGKKYASRVKGVKLTFKLPVTNLSSSVPVIVSRDMMNNLCVNQIQVDGSLLGTLVSAAYTKAGMLDITDYIANGGHMEAQAYDPIVIPPATGVPGVGAMVITHEVFIPFGYYGCKSPMSMAPMTSFIRPANFKVDTPQGSLYANYGLAPGIAGEQTVATCIGSAYIEWCDEIVIAPGFQMTRFKSTATTSASGASVADTVDLKSFGSNGTLTGVEQRAAICALLWASSAVSGDGSGAGPAESLSDISALFAGIEQTNDLQPFLDELNSEFAREAPFMRNPIYMGGATAPSQDNRRYPFFTSDGQTIVARVFPIFPARKNTHITKLPIADGSPSYQITGMFGPANGGGSDHYSYMYALYQWAPQQVAALVDTLARDDIGRWLYPGSVDANTLVPLLKLNKKNPTAPNFSKTAFLPSKMLPASMVAEMMK